MKLYYAYVLHGARDGHFCVGFSKDSWKRVYAHNAGLNPSTKYNRLLGLVFYEAFLSKRERYFKTTKQKEKRFLN